MDYNKFEDRISSWIENDLSLKERKEFEAFLDENPQFYALIGGSIILFAVFIQFYSLLIKEKISN